MQELSRFIVDLRLEYLLQASLPLTFALRRFQLYHPRRGSLVSQTGHEALRSDLGNYGKSTSQYSRVAAIAEERRHATRFQLTWSSVSEAW